MVELKDNEVVEPLDDGKIVIQPINGYRFGSDAVALAKFAAGHMRRGACVFDACSGCGIVGMLVCMYAGASVVGAEIDGQLCDMSVRASSSNGLDAVFINCDIRDKNALLRYAHSFDYVVCNPPFFKADSKASAVAPGANSELTVTLCEVCDVARLLLKNGGEFYMVYTASRLDEALLACTERGLRPKELVVNPNGKTFLLRCALGGKPGLTLSVKEF